jgi:hypothetical protein
MFGQFAILDARGMTTEMLSAWRDCMNADTSSRRVKTSIEKGFNCVSPREI